MRQFLVVLFLPHSDLPSRIDQVFEPAHVQALFAHPSVETLDVRVLRRFSRLNVHQLDLPFHTPRQKMPAGQFWTVITTNPRGPAALGDDLFQHAVTLRLAKLVSATNARHSRV